MPVMIDLHCHSTVSDGTLSPEALVAHASLQGIKVLALTDHDDLGGLSAARRAADQHGITFVNGVEISVSWRGRTLHIVGLRIDPEYAPLAEGLAAIRQGRHTRAEMMAAGLNKVGIHGSLEGAYEYAKCSIISRTHFARFLVEKGHAKDINAVFKKFLVKGKPGYVDHTWASLEDAMGWIHGSGGTAVIAHPGRYDLGRTTLLELMQAFKSLGGEAIEVVTGSHTPAQYQEFAKIAHMFGFKASLGSDYHGPQHAYIEMGRLPDLPVQCIPVWQDWPEAAAMQIDPIAYA